MVKEREEPVLHCWRDDGLHVLLGDLRPVADKGEHLLQLLQGWGEQRVHAGEEEVRRAAVHGLPVRLELPAEPDGLVLGVQRRKVHAPAEGVDPRGDLARPVGLSAAEEDEEHVRRQVRDVGEQAVQAVVP